MIAIHHRPGSFSDGWIRACEARGIAYKLVNAYASDLLTQLDGCDAFMWHWSHTDGRAALFARQVILSLEAAGRCVFPSPATAWHFDDKVGQKYLLEAVGAPLVPSHVFYDEGTALQWVQATAFPKVFKLRGGAGGSNVRLVTSPAQARRLVRRSFGRGWPSRARIHQFQERLWHLRRDRTLARLLAVSRGVGRLIFPHPDVSRSTKERGYVYFQDFVPGNSHDIRVVVIGRRAFAIKRLTRQGDFRASGSGQIIYDPEAIPLDCVRLAFETAGCLGAQSAAFDFVFDRKGQALIVEVSYGFTAEAYRRCPGTWGPDLVWRMEEVDPEGMILDVVLETRRRDKAKLCGRTEASPRPHGQGV